MELGRGIAFDRTRGVVLEGGGGKLARRLRLADVADPRLGVAFELRERTRTLSRCASLTRSSPPTNAVTETDFGAENVASHPARCSTEVTSLPFLPS